MLCLEQKFSRIISVFIPSNFYDLIRKSQKVPVRKVEFIERQIYIRVHIHVRVMKNHRLET